MLEVISFLQQPLEGEAKREIKAKNTVNKNMTPKKPRFCIVVPSYPLRSPFMIWTLSEICDAIFCLIVSDSHSSLNGIVGLVHKLNMTLFLIEVLCP